jgi:hypothetical protein
MDLESKPASDASISGGGDYYMAQADDISIDGGKIHGGEANNSNNDELFQNSRLKSLRLINTLSYLLTTVTILTTIHTTFYGNDDEYYDNYTDWMANQTLLSVATYTRYIWYVLCALQGLFVGAAFMKGLQMNVLLGYTVLAESQDEEQEANSNNNNLTSPAVHYPALCASSLLMMYSVKLNIMTCALLGSCLTTYFLVNIIKFQLLNTTVATDASTTSKKEWIQQYISIQLPFELYAGYNLGLNIMFLNIVLRKLIPNAITFDVFLAVVSLVALLIAGCYVTWKEKRLYYGVGGGLVWYLVSANINCRLSA